MRHGFGLILRFYWNPKSWLLRKVPGKTAVDVGPVGIGIGWAHNPPTSK